MFYLDTSFAAALFVPDAHSSRALQWLQARAAAALTISAWVRAEFASVLARQVRMRRMAARTADLAIEDFRQWSSTHCEIIAPAPADFDSAIDLMRDYASGLRAPDALHLAIARNWGNLTLVAFDASLNAAAVRAGIKIERL